MPKRYSTKEVAQISQPVPQKNGAPRDAVVLDAVKRCSNAYFFGASAGAIAGAGAMAGAGAAIAGAAAGAGIADAVFM